MSLGASCPAGAAQAKPTPATSAQAAVAIRRRIGFLQVSDEHGSYHRWRAANSEWRWPLAIRRFSQHRRKHAVGRLVAIQEGANIDDDLLAHVDAPFERRRAHVR